MAGPCSVESPEQIDSIAASVAANGARILRGGAFKPRTSPYSFQGIGQQGLELMRQAADKHNLCVVSEVMDHTQIPMMLDYVDMLQVGARNMQNYNLLRDLGKVSKPILLKRGISATIEELLLSAEYIMAGGNYNVVLCERGIRTFDSYLRNTLDIAAIPVIKKLSHLPIVVDPSHGTGRRDKVAPMARASVAAGADGLLIEVHNDPEKALSDGAQSLYPEQFEQLMKELRMIASGGGQKNVGRNAKFEIRSTAHQFRFSRGDLRFSDSSLVTALGRRAVAARVSGMRETPHCPLYSPMLRLRAISLTSRGHRNSTFTPFRARASRNSHQSVSTAFRIGGESG